MPQVQDLEALNPSFIKWFEEAIQACPRENDLNDDFE
jgi:hypothetical protein